MNSGNLNFLEPSGPIQACNGTDSEGVCLLPVPIHVMSKVTRKFGGGGRKGAKWFLLILYCISSRLVTLLKVTDAPIQGSDIFYLTVSFKFLKFAFRYSFFLFLKCLLTIHLRLFRLSALLWLGSCKHSILVCFLSFKKPKHSSSNQGLCCFN
jgi:hypothetical protein